MGFFNPDMEGILPISIILDILVYWLVIGFSGLIFIRNRKIVSQVLFPLGASGGIALLFITAFSITHSPTSAILPLGLPDLPFHIRLDALSTFFLFLLGISSTGICFFSSGYFSRDGNFSPGLVCLQFHLFLVSMAFVFLADDAYLFMIAWETMAMSSYFLVVTDHKVPEIRRAGYIYLLMAHISATAVLLCFGVLQKAGLQGIGGSYTFEMMRHLNLDNFWATTAFLLALFGFGAKAGLLPVHVWLPEAHPAAPSPVSALMSGVMLKTAIYGLLRVTFDLLHLQIWWWGILVLTLGLITAFFGVIFSAVQNDMKRLLAYSSIENIGIILSGIGLTITFQSYHMQALASLALIATLYHCLNHACFKSLLFLATGSVLHATEERNLGKLGGLIHRMPWVAVLALIGTLAIAGLPPLNGFVSEWLLLQTFLLTTGFPQPYLNMLVPVAAAGLVLAAALAAYVMVKFYALIFLGQPREKKLLEAKDANYWERLGLSWLASCCVLLGLFPVEVIKLLNAVPGLLIGQALGKVTSQTSWLFLTPISPDRASYSPMLFFSAATIIILITFLGVRLFYHGRIRRSTAWDCGYPMQTFRMQETAESFGQPIRTIFSPFFRMRSELPSPSDPAPHYHNITEDRSWYVLYFPIGRFIHFLSNLFGRLQQGRISIYLLYSFLTLILLLLLI